MDEKIFSFIRSLPQFEHLSDEELRTVANLMEEKKFKAGEYIFSEGDKSNYLCIIHEGEVDIIKRDKENKHEHKIRTFKQGKLFGELNFIDASQRSASARAVKDSSILTLRPEIFKEKSLSEELQFKVVADILKQVIPHLRETSESYVHSLESEIEHLEKRRQFGQFFIYILGLIGIGSLYGTLAENAGLDVRSQLVSALYLLSVLVPCLIIIKLFKIPIVNLGITHKNFFKSLFQGIVVSVSLVLIFYLIHRPLLEYLKARGGTFKPLPFNWGMLLFYFPHAYVQEFISRGVAQTCLQNFYDDQRGIKTVFLVAGLFAIFHMHISITAAVMTFVASLLFGFVYIRSYNLIGVTIVHCVVGLVGMAYGLFG